MHLVHPLSHSFYIEVFGSAMFLVLAIVFRTSTMRVLRPINISMIAVNGFAASASYVEATNLGPHSALAVALTVAEFVGVATLVNAVVKEARCKSQRSEAGN